MLTDMQQKSNKKLTKGIVKKVAEQLGISVNATYMRIKRNNLETIAIATKLEKEHQKKVKKTLNKYYKVTNNDVSTINEKGD